MKNVQQISRRSFLSDLGKGTAAVAILGLASCSSSGSDAAATSPTGTNGSTSDSDGTEAASADTSLAWRRVNLGFVSAYVLSRGSEITIVDTGVEGSEGDILDAISAVGGTWSSVKHVILTHSHGDHVGSVGAVLDAAPDAAGYAGTADLDSITAPVDLTGLNGGDEVFGLQILATPGHTPGHISVFDPGTGLFVAGDALNTSDGNVTGPNEEFTSDLDLANESVKEIAQRDFQTLLVGHGDPITSAAGAAVKELAATL